MRYTRHILLPMALAIGSSAFVGSSALAAPGIEERSAGTFAAAPASDASIAVYEQLQRFQEQVENLTGRVEQLEYELKQVREQEKARYVDLDGRVGTLEKAAQEKPAAATAAATPAEGGTTESPAPAAAGEDEQALFDKAIALVREKKYDDAISAFEQQLKRFPAGELVPTTMYWLGEMWQVASTPDVPKSGRFFYRVYNEYPKSSRAAAAMYKHGLVLCRDDVTKGRLTLSRVLVQYPGTPDATLADTALKNQCK